jgi:2-polyprenyl-3-methyl-5-hydroxy-6-metoxy-1,4-benzoquinol methylase
MSTLAKDLYEEHHSLRRAPGFSILKEDRGRFFASVIGAGKRVLDLGCRDGALTSYFAQGNSVLGVDVDEVALARAKESLGIETRFVDAHGDWHELASESFDAVVAGEVLEHLFYPDRIVAQVAKHLISGGVFVGSVPNAFSLKNRLRYLLGSKLHTPLEDPTHINHFSASDLHRLLSKQFSSVEIRGLGRYRRLAALSPTWFAFDLAFVARI